MVIREYEWRHILAHYEENGKVYVMDIKNLIIVTKNWTLNVTAAARKIIQRWRREPREWSVDDFDAMKIRRGKSAKAKSSKMLYGKTAEDDCKHR